MANMEIDVKYLSGLEIPTWKGVKKRIISQIQKFRFDNRGRSISVGDRVKINPGNDVSWNAVNLICIVYQYWIL